MDPEYKRGYFDGLSEGREIATGGVLFVGFLSFWISSVGRWPAMIVVAFLTIAGMAYVNRARTKSVP